ncbi:MAG: hypothetical protein ACR2LQ_11010 [Acidimicrobiales bacterium]
MTERDDDRTDHARDGIAHLQKAAKELIAAGRALLDAADELVDDPATLGQLGDALATIAKLAGSVLGGSAPRQGDDDDEPRVQRIRVS